MATVDWIVGTPQTERVVGRGNGTYADVANRPLRTVLTLSGQDPDANFLGFVPVGTAGLRNPNTGFTVSADPSAPVFINAGKYAGPSANSFGNRMFAYYAKVDYSTAPVQNFIGFYAEGLVVALGTTLQRLWTYYAGPETSTTTVESVGLFIAARSGGGANYGVKVDDVTGGTGVYGAGDPLAIQTGLGRVQLGDALSIQPTAGKFAGGLTTYFNVRADFTVDPSVTFSAYSYIGTVSTPAAAMTLGQAYAFSAGTPSIGAGSAINTSAGFRAGNQGVAALQGWGFSYDGGASSATTEHVAFRSGALTGAAAVSAGLRIVSVTGATVNNYGILLGDVTGTGAFAIKTGLGAVQFGGTLGVGGTVPVSWIGIIYQGTPTGSSNSWGAYIGPVHNAPTATSSFGITIAPTTTGAGTLTMSGLQVVMAKGASATVTAAEAITIGAFGYGTTSNVGIHINDITGTGAFAILTGVGVVQFGDTIDNIAKTGFHTVSQAAPVVVDVGEFAGTAIPQGDPIMFAYYPKYANGVAGGTFVGYRARSPVLGAGASVVNIYPVSVEPSTTPASGDSVGVKIWARSGGANNYGLLIGDITTGNAFAIKTGAGLVSFGAQVAVATSLIVGIDDGASPVTWAFRAGGPTFSLGGASSTFYGLLFDAKAPAGAGSTVVPVGSFPRTTASTAHAQYIGVWMNDPQLAGGASFTGNMTHFYAQSNAVACAGNKVAYRANDLSGGATYNGILDAGNVSGATPFNFGIRIGTVSGGSANNYGILLGDVTGTGAFAIKTGQGNVQFGDGGAVFGFATFSSNGQGRALWDLIGAAASSAVTSVRFFGSQGTAVAPTVIGVGQVVGDIQWFGYATSGGFGGNSAGRIHVEAVTTTAAPIEAKMVFTVNRVAGVVNGSTVAFSAAAGLQVFGPFLGNVALEVGADVHLGSGTNIGVYSHPRAPNPSGGIIAFQALAQTLPAAYTVTTAYAYLAKSAVLGSGSTIGTAYGLYVEDQTVAGTNYAIYTNAGLVRFGGAVSIVATSTTGPIFSTNGAAIGTGHSMTSSTTGSAFQKGMWLTNTFGTDATSRADALYVASFSAAGGSPYTLSTVIGVNIAGGPGHIGTNGTWTTFVALHLGADTPSGPWASGAGTDYGLYISPMTGTGAVAILTGSGKVQLGDVVTLTGGSTVVNAAALDIVTTAAVTSTFFRGIHVIPVAVSSITTTFYGIEVGLQAQAGAYTMTAPAMLHVLDASWTAGNPTATTLYGIKIENITKGTTNYAIFTGTGLVSLGGGLTIPAGNVGIGIGVAPYVALNINETLSSSSGGVEYGVVMDVACSSDTTGSFFGVFSRPHTVAAAFTVSSVYGFIAGDIIKGAGSTITTQYGVYVNSQTQGVTNYALFTNAGLVAFGDVVGMRSPNTSYALNIDGPVAGLAGIIQAGINISTVSTSAATSAVSGIRLSVTTAAAVFTTNEVSGIFITDAGKGAGSTITTQYGILIADQTKGTTNYAIKTGAGLVSFGGQVQLGAITAPLSFAAAVSPHLLIGSTSLIVRDSGDATSIATFAVGSLNLASGVVLQANGTQVVSTRRTGWTAWTGTADRTSHNADGPATATQLGQALKALLDDLIAHGLIGA